VSFETVNGDAKDLEFTYLEAKLDAQTAPLAKGHEAICIFVNDDAGADALQVLHDNGVDTGSERQFRETKSASGQVYRAQMCWFQQRLSLVE
jgi:hypothetical protein